MINILSGSQRCVITRHGALASLHGVRVIKDVKLGCSGRECHGSGGVATQRLGDVNGYLFSGACTCVVSVYIQRTKGEKEIEIERSSPTGQL